jgi:hypothetical protein
MSGMIIFPVIRIIVEPYEILILFHSLLLHSFFLLSETGLPVRVLPPPLEGSSLVNAVSEIFLMFETNNFGK